MSANTQSRKVSEFKNIFSIMENYLGKTQLRENNQIATIRDKMQPPEMASSVKKSPGTEKFAKNGYSINRLRNLKKTLEDNFNTKLLITVLHILNKNGERVKYERDNIAFKLGNMKKGTITELELINLEKKVEKRDKLFETKKAEVGCPATEPHLIKSWKKLPRRNSKIK